MPESSWIDGFPEKQKGPYWLWWSAKPYIEGDRSVLSIRSMVCDCPESIGHVILIDSPPSFPPRRLFKGDMYQPRWHPIEPPGEFL